MSRSGYSGDCEGRELGLWRASVNRAIRGKRGQAFLRDLIAALDVMPEKKLAAEVFVEAASTGGCCAMGAVALARGLSREQLAHVDEYDRNVVGNVLDIAPALAAEIAYENDEGNGYRAETDEQRWQRMRKWAEANLVNQHQAVQP